MTADQLALSFERKQAGQRTVLSHNSEWLDKVFSYVQALPKGVELDAETIRGACGAPDHPNALGAAVSQLKRAGLIEKVGYRVATRASRHAAEIRVYARA